MSIKSTPAGGDLPNPPPSPAETIKCVVWDLDNTLWDGVLLEGSEVKPRVGLREVLRTLDERGILQSIASRNDEAAAMEKLRALEIDQYFLYPQINWSSKASSLRAIARHLNISLGTFAFVDDQPFEREEVAFSLPQVLCIDPVDLASIPALPRMQPRFITEDSRRRREMYMSDEQRNHAQSEFVGTPDEFLATLNMRFTIAAATERDLQRAEELTVRTHQLNTTGYTYSYEELDAFRKSPDYRLLVASLEDKYGSYGTIGLALIRCEPATWSIKLLLMSCRVMSRGVGTVLLNHIVNATPPGAKLRAEFISNDRNRMMYITYKFAGFQEVGTAGNAALLEHDGRTTQAFPSHTQVLVCDAPIPFISGAFQVEDAKSRDSRGSLQVPADLAAEIRALGASEMRQLLDALAYLLVDAVDSGASVGYLAPIPLEKARVYWQHSAEAAGRGSVLVLGAFVCGGLVGTAQLQLDTPENQPHRAQVSKVLVARQMRRRGLAKQLMAALEAQAAERGRTLLTLHTVVGAPAERLYVASGYTCAGAIPGYALMPDGAPAATATFYKLLSGKAVQAAEALSSDPTVRMERQK